MGLKSDKWIIKQAYAGMIEPFAATQERRNVISYGVSSYGYDMRVADEWTYYTSSSTVIDPKSRQLSSVTESVKSDEYVIGAGDFVLCRSVEYFRIPRNVTALVLGKSTYARCGLHCLVTPLEPAWEGHVTIELANLTQSPIRIYANEGIAQVLFYSGKDCLTSYKDKRGKYQGQVGVTLPFTEQQR